MTPPDVSGRPAGSPIGRFLERLAALTPAEWAALQGATPPLRRAAFNRLRSAAAFVRAMLGAKPGSYGTPGDVDAVYAAVDAAVARGVVPDDERDLVAHAGIAVLLRDVLPPQEFEQWYGPFEKVIPRSTL